MSEIIIKEENVSKVLINVEVLLQQSCSDRIESVEAAALSFLEIHCTNYVNGIVSIENDDYLSSVVSEIRVCDVPLEMKSIPFWQAELRLHIYSLNTEGSVAENLDGASDVTAYHEWLLPCKEFEFLWDHLVYDENLKNDLLNYATSAFIFSQNHVNSSIISLNRVCLLHGPPGTGKTSLCKALSQKLAIRYFSVFAHIALIEINSHSLFSKWFSESGKLVMRLFDYINELLSSNDTLLFILIDEVESLSASRKASMSGSEPSDGMRVVNALLTQIDKLRNNPNVMILATSNLSSSIDDAFIDRADIKRFIGNPGPVARYWILKDCIDELCRASIIDNLGFRIGEYEDVIKGKDCDNSICVLLYQIVEESDGLSGRALRKLPFQAYSQWLCGKYVNLQEFLLFLKRAVEKEKEDRHMLLSI